MDLCECTGAKNAANPVPTDVEIGPDGVVDIVVGAAGRRVMDGGDGRDNDVPEHHHIARS